MRAAYPAGEVRQAERALMALVPEGALMRRAAAGLAATCAGLLGRVYGSRVAVLAGTGDNGGDALFAGARLAGRGPAAGSPGPATPGRRTRSAAPAWSSTASWASAGAAGCASRRPRWRGWRSGRDRGERWWSPPTCPAGWTPTPG